MTLDEWLQIPGNSQQKLADRLGKSQALVSQHLNWLRGLRGRENNAIAVSGDRAVEIEIATDHQVTRFDTRGDLFGPRPIDREAA